MPIVIHRTSFALTAIALVVLAGCDSKSKNDQQSEGALGLPGFEQPGPVDAEAGGAGDADPEGQKPAGTVFGPDEFAREILAGTGVWRVRREIDTLLTPAEWEADGNTSVAGPAEMDLIALNWNLQTTGFLSVVPGNNGTQVTQCISDRTTSTVNETSLLSFIEPDNYYLCEERKTRFKKLDDNSYLMEQRCEAGDSVTLVLDKIAETGALYNAAISFVSNVLPEVYSVEDGCGTVFADLVTVGEAYDLVPDAHGTFYDGHYSAINWYIPYGEGMINLEVDAAEINVGEYRVGNSGDDANPQAWARITYSSPIADDEWHFRADTGTVSVVQNDADGVKLAFSVEGVDGEVVEGQATITFE